MTVEAVELGRRYPLLDALRTFAALLVVAEHLRSALFKPHGTLPDSEILTAVPFYAATTLGHQAVLIFFALSGYLVGGGVTRQFLGGRWSTKKYFLKRLTRLWIVLLPALVFRLIVDTAVAAIFGPQIYDGTAIVIASLPTASAPADHSALTFIGNAFFLQGLFTPVYGSNGPLWSLAYEFWYYVLFPLAVFAAFGAKSQVRWLAAISVVVIALILPFSLLKLGLVWLAGALLAPPIGDYLPFKSSTVWAPVLAVSAIALFLPASALGIIPGGDVPFGLLVAFCIPFLCQSTRWMDRLKPTFTFGAEVSYSVYLFHFPLVVATGAIFGYQDRLSPSFYSFALFGGVGILVVGLCLVL